MRTRGRQHDDAQHVRCGRRHRSAHGLALGTLVLLSCTVRDPGVTLPDLCEEQAVRRCEHACGHGVQHCLDPKRGWGECTCVVSGRDWLDGSVPEASAAGAPGGGAGGTQAGAGNARAGNAGSF